MTGQQPRLNSHPKKKGKSHLCQESPCGSRTSFSSMLALLLTYSRTIKKKKKPD